MKAAWRRRALSAALGLLLVKAAPAASELLPLSLEELMAIPVSAAAKREQPPAAAPSAVSIVSADEIRRFGWKTLDEILSSLRGVYSTYDRAYQHLGIRGFGRPGDYNGRVLLLLNGVPTNDGMYDQAAVGRDGMIDLAMIERVEYVPGPGSVLYGGNALFGVVNVVTRARAGSELTLGLGSDGERFATLRSGQRSASGVDFAAALTSYQRQGETLYFPAYEGSGFDPYSREMDRERTGNVHLRLDRGGLSGELIAGRRYKRVPGGAYGVDLNDPRNRYIDETALLTIRDETRLNVDWVLNSQLYAGLYRSDGDAVFGGVYEQDAARNEYGGGELALTGTPLSGHTTTLGLSVRDDWQRRFINLSGTVDVPRRNGAWFVQDDWQLGEALSLVVGLRGDRDNRGHRLSSPRYAVVYHNTSGGVVKWIHGRAWRPPNAYETSYRYDGLSEPNPGLKSERVDTRELVAEQRWASGDRLAVSFYRNRMSDLVALQTDPQSGIQQHFNVGGALLQGLEIEALTQRGGLTLRANASLQRARMDNGVEIANSPRRLANLLLSLPLRGVLLAWETRYVGPRRVDGGDIRRQAELIGGYSVSSLTLGGLAMPGLSWEFRISNLFDRRYLAVIGDEFNAAFPAQMNSRMPTMVQDGRAMRASLRWQF